MIISPKHKFVFFKPMKTAGTSVEHALHMAAGKDQLCTGALDKPDGDVWAYPSTNNTNSNGQAIFHTHTWASLLENRFIDLGIENEFSSYRYISMTRNPWDALVSYYWYNVFARDELKLLQKWPESQWGRICKRSFNEWIDIKSSLEDISSPNRIDYNPLEYISMCNESHVDKKINNWIKFETLQKDFNLLCFLLGIEHNELKRFKSGHKLINKHYSFYYTDDSMKKVEDAFPKTIKKFGYSFDRRVK
ncbi:MAG: hypothetical protein CBD74_14820 [Saprospirales bacterium TMED214]|nr:MAG: hypothetical protein CBD74_14820 [Saprospirales bacterium TMED214]